MAEVAVEVYNFSPSFAHFTMKHWANIQGKNLYTDTMDLGDLSLHKGIEHDASLTREDTCIFPDQSKPDLKLIDQLLASATGNNGQLLTVDDLSHFSSIRRAESRAHNRQFSLSLGEKLFGSANAATFLLIFGGVVEDLRILLKEERIPDGWESKVKAKHGLTMCSFNKTVLAIESGITEDGTQKCV